MEINCSRLPNGGTRTHQHDKYEFKLRIWGGTLMFYIFSPTFDVTFYFHKPLMELFHVTPPKTAVILPRCKIAPKGLT